MYTSNDGQCKETLSPGREETGYKDTTVSQVPPAC